MIQKNFFLSSFYFFIIGIVENKMINENIKVCVDSSRVDFPGSCKYDDFDCQREIEYIKNFQDYTDYYFTRNSQVYHSIDDAIYISNCELTKQVIFFSNSIWVIIFIINEFFLIFRCGFQMKLINATTI
jgi:hypothetical protein